jgi:hypothetical protein
MLAKLVEDPPVTKEHTLPNPGPTAILQVGSDDAGILAVTGVKQCTAIFFYNPNNKRRVAAHFGGFKGSRTPKTEHLLEAWKTLAGEWGGGHIQVTLCKNGSSPENSIDEAREQVQALSPSIEIIVEEYPGDSFYMFGDGKLFGGGKPCSKSSFSFGGSRGKQIDQNK